MDKKKFTMDMEQQVNDGRLEADHRRLDYRNFTNDEEVTLLPHKRDMDVPLTIQFRISVMGQIHQIYNEKTGYFRRSPSKGLAQGGTTGSDLR